MAENLGDLVVVFLIPPGVEYCSYQEFYFLSRSRSKKFFVISSYKIVIIYFKGDKVPLRKVKIVR